jgi:hypothetical protein
MRSQTGRHGTIDIPARLVHILCRGQACLAVSTPPQGDAAAASRRTVKTAAERGQ